MYGRWGNGNGYMDNAFYDGLECALLRNQCNVTAATRRWGLYLRGMIHAAKVMQEGDLLARYHSDKGRPVGTLTSSLAKTISSFAIPIQLDIEISVASLISLTKTSLRPIGRSPQRASI